MDNIGVANHVGARGNAVQPENRRIADKRHLKRETEAFFDVREQPVLVSVDEIDVIEQFHLCVVGKVEDAERLSEAKQHVRHPQFLEPRAPVVVAEIKRLAVAEAFQQFTLEKSLELALEPRRVALAEGPDKRLLAAFDLLPQRRALGVEILIRALEVVHNPGHKHRILGGRSPCPPDAGSRRVEQRMGERRRALKLDAEQTAGLGLQLSYPVRETASRYQRFVLFHRPPPWFEP